MPTITTDVDVDLSDFDYDELVDALEDKLKWDKDQDSRKGAIKLIKGLLNVKTDDLKLVSSNIITDEKLILFTENMDKIPLEDLERFVHQHGGQVFNYMIQIGK